MVTRPIERYFNETFNKIELSQQFAALLFPYIGPSCNHEGVTLDPGQTYEKTTGPKCYKCHCRKGGDLHCCEWVYSHIIQFLIRIPVLYGWNIADTSWIKNVSIRLTLHLKFGYLNVKSTYILPLIAENKIIRNGFKSIRHFFKKALQ